jgi:8-oxo-dGTP diphosphatase
VSAGSEADPPDLVRAAGGAVHRRGSSGEVEVLLVHRPRYDDWSLPKGKLDPEESFEEAAVREVEEETGLRCELGEPLPEVRYVDNRGRPKVVRYWSMTPVADAGFTPNDEVDQLRWAPVADARRLLSYAHDRDLLDQLAPPPATGSGG